MWTHNWVLKAAGCTHNAQRGEGISAQTALWKRNHEYEQFGSSSPGLEITHDMKTAQLDSAVKGRREELIPSRAKQDLVCSVNISEPLCLDSSVVCSLVSGDYFKYLPVYLLEDLSLNSPGFVGAVGAASLHLRLPQEFHSECPQQEEEKDQR